MGAPIEVVNDLPWPLVWKFALPAPDLAPRPPNEIPTEDLAGGRAQLDRRAAGYQAKPAATAAEILLNSLLCKIISCSENTTFLDNRRAAPTKFSSFQIMRPMTAQFRKKSYRQGPNEDDGANVFK